MKRSLTLLAALSTLAGAASAQSSTVIIYGVVDQGIGKPLGTDDIQVRDGHASRLGFRGVEDLGDGWAALFGMEHRFAPDTGTDATVIGSGPIGPNAGSITAATATNKFWNGYSTVGIRGPYGSINLGRQYTPAYLIQNMFDPFGGVTVAALRDSSMRVATIGKIRVDNSIRYDFAGGGFTVAASIAEGSQTPALSGPDRPVSAALTYTVGPVWLAAAYENPANTNDKMWNLGGRYTVGNLQLWLGFAGGTTAAEAKAKGLILSGLYTLGSGEIKAGFARTKVDDVTTTQRSAVGYHYYLSKRTKLYTDFVHDSKLPTEKNGWDFGLSHSF